MRSRECGHCHRIGTRQFVETTDVRTGYACANDRACRARQVRRALQPVWFTGELCHPITRPHRTTPWVIDTLRPAEAYL